MAASQIYRTMLVMPAIVLVALAHVASAQNAPAVKSTKHVLSKATPSRPVSPLGDRTVVAQVNGKPIYKSDVDQALNNLARGQPIEPANLPQVQAGVLSQLISQRLLFGFIEQNKLTATPEEVDRAIDAIKRSNPKIEQQVRQAGQTMAALRTQVAGELSMLKFVQEYGKPEVIQAYFNRNKRHFDGTQVRVSHILLRPASKGDEAEAGKLREEAIRIKADIEAGKLTFADAAKQFSAGPSRREGGDLGFINRDGPMVETFTSAAFELEEGKISEPVTTNFGVHLIVVTEVKPGDKELDQVREKLMRPFRQWLIDKLIERELKKAKIELNDEFPHYKPGTRELVTPERLSG
jgi:parvulin-like peptidyl-prolyl isomerase